MLSISIHSLAPGVSNGTKPAAVYPDGNPHIIASLQSPVGSASSVINCAARTAHRGGGDVAVGRSSWGRMRSIVVSGLWLGVSFCSRLSGSAVRGPVHGAPPCGGEGLGRARSVRATAAVRPCVRLCPPPPSFG
ncbi:hypothetical protein GCM10010231_19460 [Streptomyces sindenensis]|nr:hypothetical protein GCM10010231_19460 [Streptomyces sindenensis]